MKLVERPEPRAAINDVIVQIQIGGDIGKRSARLVRPGGTLVSIVGPSEAGPLSVGRSTSLSSPIATN